MKLENNKGLRILRPNEGMLLFRKDEAKESRNYYEMIYLAKFDTMENYGEVTYDYVYGKDYDCILDHINETNNNQQETIDLQSEVLDFILFGDTDEKQEFRALQVDNDVYNPMAVYSANRIMKHKISYNTVINRFPELKNDIDSILSSKGFEK